MGPGELGFGIGVRHPESRRRRYGRLALIRNQAALSTESSSFTLRALRVRCIACAMYGALRTASLVVLALMGPFAVAAQCPDRYTPVTSPQRDADIAALKTLIASRDPLDCKAEGVGINRLDYYDFDRDADSFLILVASDCGAGTGGPNVHAVFARDGQGGFIEYPLPDVERRYYEALRGNRNYDLTIDLTVDPGRLVATWYEERPRRATTDRSVLVIRYKWHGGAFVVDSIATPSSHPGR